jgi:glycosyltransferase involved in cell wall biosynthesis
MHILFLSTLFPDVRRPTFGIHNANLVRRLATVSRVSVVAPRPRLSAFLARPGSSVAERCPEDTALAPIFPAVPYLPRIGSAVNHRLYARWLAPSVQRICRAQEPPGVLLAAWAYPDACAAVRLAGPLALPCVVITQGTDINDYLGYPLRRGVILRHLGRAAAVVARSEALRRRLVEAGLPEGRVRTIHNGVDTDFFRPAVDRQAVRRAAGLGPADVAVLFVGNFAPVKDPLLAVRAVAVLREQFPEQAWRLFMLGDGPLRTKVKAAAGALGGDVTLAGVCSPAQVLRFMQAADVLCVPSRNEGIPNVIREALACGLPVAATRVGGVPEVLTDPRTGELVEPGRPVLMADALARVVARGPQGEACRRQALAFSWDETVRRYSELFAVLATPP